jgi:hypothetical protein
MVDDLSTVEEETTVDDAEKEALDAFVSVDEEDIKPAEPTGKAAKNADDLGDVEDEPEPEGEEKGDKEESGKDDTKKADEKDDESPAESAIKKRLKDLGESLDDSEAGEEEDEPETDDGKTEEKAKDVKEKDNTKDDQKKSDKESSKSKSPSLTKEAVAGYLGILDDIELPDKPIIVGDAEVNLKEFADDFPEHFQASMVLAGIAVQKAMDSIETVKPDQVVAPDKVKSLEEKVENQADQIDAMLYFDNVDDVLIRQNPESTVRSRRLSKSDEFTEWLSKQPSGIKNKLAYSPDPEDGALVINLYLEQTTKKKTEKHDTKARDKKKRQTDIHSSTIRSSASKQKASDDGSDEDQARAGFNEEAKEE